MLLLVFPGIEFFIYSKFLVPFKVVEQISSSRIDEPFINAYEGETNEHSQCSSNIADQRHARHNQILPLDYFEWLFRFVVSQ